MSEGAPERKPVSAEEAERVRAAHEAADPTNYSALAPRGRMESVGTVHSRGEGDYLNPVLEADGETWYKLDDGSLPRLQQIVARLLKGIINVSDVVERDGEYYSKRMPHDRIEERLSEEETDADLELLYLVADDSDHFTRDLKPTSSGHNSRLEEGTSTYHDFAEAGFSPEQTDLRLRRRLTARGLARLQEKLQLLAERYDSAEGKQLAETIYQEAGGPLDTNIGFDEFYQVLIKRIRGAKLKVSEAQRTKKR